MAKQYVLNQRLHRKPTRGLMRRIANLVHIKSWTAKAGLGIFGGTLLLGTGVVMASLPAVHSHVTDATDTQTVPSVEASTTENTPIQPQVISTSTSTNNSSSSDQSNAAESHVEITLNGENISVPANGSVNHTVMDNNGIRTINVSTQSSGQNSGFTFTNVQTNSFSTSINSSLNTSVNTNVNSGGSN